MLKHIRGPCTRDEMLQDCPHKKFAQVNLHQIVQIQLKLVCPCAILYFFLQYTDVYWPNGGQKDTLLASVRAIKSYGHV